MLPCFFGMTQKSNEQPFLITFLVLNMFSTTLELTIVIPLNLISNPVLSKVEGGVGNLFNFEISRRSCFALTKRQVFSGEKYPKMTLV